MCLLTVIFHSCLLHGILFRGVTRTEYLEVITMDNVTVFSYNSTTRSRVPLPDWLKNHDGKQHWKDNNTIAILNQNNMAKAMEVVSQHINQTGGKARNHILRYGRCGLHPDGRSQGSLTHACNGREFMTFTLPTSNIQSNLNSTTQSLEKVERSQNFLKNQRSSYMRRKTFFFFLRVTCHVTGFYPWEVQVEWQKDGWLPLVEGVTSGEVLPNGDGTLQLKKTLTISGGNQRCVTIQSYTCLVQHSSLSQNITRTWGKENEHIFGLWGNLKVTWRKPHNMQTPLTWCYGSDSNHSPRTVLTTVPLCCC
uniref:Ig-like domain-containing protein n=1 Tax=Paramormyrops kingsleyae TaxID=1676925 RepID=A0A3B3RJP7_9TELE